MEHVQEEIKDAFEHAFPPCDGTYAIEVMTVFHNNSYELTVQHADWTEVDVVDRITQIVARVSSRMFGGTTLSRNKEWIQSSIAFATDGFIGAQELKKYPEFLKPLVARFIPAIKNIKKHYTAAEEAAIPLLKERASTGSKAFDLLYWMDEDAKGAEKDHTFRK